MVPGNERTPPGIGPLVGAVAGFAVGALDAGRAAWVTGQRTGLALAVAALLGAGLCSLAGLAAGAALELLARLSAWGRQRRAPAWSLAAAGTFAGLLAAAATAATVWATAGRNNRFLAAGLVALAGLGSAAGSALLLPALARLLALRRAGPAEPRRPAAIWLLTVPAVGGLLAAVTFLIVSRTPLQLRGSALSAAMATAAIPAVFLPMALTLATRVRRRLPLPAVLAVAGLVYVLPLVAFVVRYWTVHFRFVPWLGIGLGATGALMAGGVLLVLPRVSTRRCLVLAGSAAVAAVVLVLAAGESEPARKAMAARSGLGGPLLSLATRALDRDEDGYPQLLGGGDCDDGDPEVHPGASDWPGDGVDQDCRAGDARAAALRSPAFAPVPEGVPAGLNLLFITVDTVRADHLGCYGYGRPTSPEIDRLAKEGAIFENAWAHAPSTRYSMPAIATGRWPSAIEWDESIWWPRIAPGVRTVAEAFKALGHRTGALYTYSYFARADARGFERGVDVYDDRRAALHVNIRGPMESRGSSSREITDDAVAFIDSQREQRFFLWVHYYDPHLSYEAHAEVPDFGSSRVDLYDHEIRFTDMHIGRLLAHLRARGLWDRTAVLLTGDHGEGFGEHGVTEHGYHLYAPQTKVPLVLRVPGLEPRRIKTAVGHVDVAPTLVNLARGPHEPGFNGRSLVPLLSGGPEDPDAAVFQEVTSERGKKRAMASATHHLVWNWTPENTTECYDLRADPQETRDLWGRSPAPECERLRERLHDLVAALAFPPGFADKIAWGVGGLGAGWPPPQKPIDARIGDAVRVLGYDLEPGQVSSGGTVDVVYHFESLRRLPTGWRLFFHLEGPGGFRNLDHTPVGGVYPLDRWRPGQRIRDRHPIAFPSSVSPPGVYTLYLGAFRGNERLPIDPAELAGGSRRLRLFSVTVR